MIPWRTTTREGVINTGPYRRALWLFKPGQVEGINTVRKNNFDRKNIPYLKKQILWIFREMVKKHFEDQNLYDVNLDFHLADAHKVIEKLDSIQDQSERAQTYKSTFHRVLEAYTKAYFLKPQKIFDAFREIVNEILYPKPALRITDSMFRPLHQASSKTSIQKRHPWIQELLNMNNGSQDGDFLNALLERTIDRPKFKLNSYNSTTKEELLALYKEALRSGQLKAFTSILESGFFEGLKTEDKLKILLQVNHDEPDAIHHYQNYEPAWNQVKFIYMLDKPIDEVISILITGFGGGKNIQSAMEKEARVAAKSFKPAPQN